MYSKQSDIHIDPRWKWYFNDYINCNISPKLLKLMTWINYKLITWPQFLVKRVVISSCVKFIVIKKYSISLFLFLRKTVLEEHLLLSGSHVWTRYHKTVSMPHVNPIGLLGDGAGSGAGDGLVWL